MCEFCQQHNQNRASGRYAHEAYPIQSAIKNYGEVRRGHCALTGAPLSHHYIHNAGQCTKAFHENVYQGFINQRSQVCQFCERTPLSPEKVRDQYSEPRELSHHFCEECVEYVALLFRKVAGYDNSFLLDEQRPNQLPAPESYRYADNDDDVVVIDAEYRETGRREPPRQHYARGVRPPTPEEKKMIEHTPQERFSDFFKNSKKNAQDFVYVRSKD